MNSQATRRLAFLLRVVFYLFSALSLWGFLAGGALFRGSEGPPSLVLFASLLLLGIVVWVPYLPQRIAAYFQQLLEPTSSLLAYCFTGLLVFYAPLAYIATSAPVLGYLQPVLWWKLLVFTTFFFWTTFFLLTILFSLGWSWLRLKEQGESVRVHLRTALFICLIWFLLIGGILFILSHSYRFTVNREEDFFAKRVLIMTEIITSNTRAHLRRDLYHPDELQEILNTALNNTQELEVSLLDKHGVCFMYAARELQDWPPPQARHTIRQELQLGRPGGPPPDKWPGHRRRNMWIPGEEFGWRKLPEGPQAIVITLDKRPLWNQIHSLRLQVLLYGSVAFLAAAMASLLIVTRQRQRSLHTQLTIAQERAAHHQRLAQLGAGLAHETKNPLGLIRGMAQSIYQPHTDVQEGRDYANQIIDEVDRIAGQLNQFLGFARPQTPQLKPLALEELFGALLELVAGEASEKGVTIHYDAHQLVVLADEQLLRRALLNLLLNALNACATGDSISLLAKQEKGRVTIVVQDSGMGITADDLEHVREPYFTRSPGGTGLGLAIVDEIIANHGWRMHIESTAGEGARVTIEGILAQA